ncbi:glycosyl transferase family 2 protein [Candidatus Magnetoovum chiemensis]|nr:glycosyl transferase family 2 protein [Candidatus Magnetoovum chiemensis]
MNNQIHLLPPSYKGMIYDKLLVKNYIISPSVVMMPKAVFMDVGGFDTSREMPEDHDLFIRLSEKYEFYYVSSFHVTYAVGKTSRSANPVVKEETYFYRLSKYHKQIIERGLLDKALAVYYDSVALLYRRGGNFKKASQLQSKSAAHCPTVSSIVKAVLSVCESYLKINIIDAILFNHTLNKLRGLRHKS